MYPHLFQKGLMHDTILTKEADGTIATQGLAMIYSHGEQGGSHPLTKHVLGM